MKKWGILTTALIAAMTVHMQAAAEDIVILFTNDVHCGIEEGIGYASVTAYRDYMKTQTPYVTLVDCGDAIQGEFIGLTSKGSYVVDIMNEMGYEFAVLGNHEFDYGMDVLSERIQQADAQYLGCNVNYSGSGENKLSKLKPYALKEYGETTVGFVGVTTPFSIGSSTPSFFMEDGEYVYDFTGGDNGQALYERVQDTVDACRKEGADYVIALTHLGDGEENSPYSSNELAWNTTGIDAILDGHAHSVLPCWIEENGEEEKVLICSTGTKLANLGQLVISEEGVVTTGLISNYPESDEKLQEYIDVIQAVYEGELQKKVGTSEVTLTGYTADGIRLVRNRETTIGNFCADAYRAIAGADIAVVNGGGVRADIEAGDITYEDIYAVHPYGNTLCMTEVTGQEILDMLEMSSRKTQQLFEEDGNAVGEEGGFLSVSGMKYTIDTTVESSVVTDENEMFVSVEGQRRVKDVCVLTDNGEYEPIDPQKTYTMAAHNYLLKEGGDGLNMFMDHELLLDESMLDYQVLLEYIAQLGGVIGESYAQTEGRIIVE